MSELHKFLFDGLSRISEHYVKNAKRYRLGLRKLA